MGSSWPSGHVAVDLFYSWNDQPGGNEICLNLDTVQASELETEIDELIAELQALKKEVPVRFNQWTTLYEKTARKS